MKNLFFLIALICNVTILKSQWNPDVNQNLKVVDTQSNVYSFSASMSDGKTYVVYWRKSVDEPINQELRLQILDQNGNKPLGDDGILLSNQITSPSIDLTEIVVDSSNNLYVGVTSTTDSGQSQGYLFKVTPQGNSVWSNGIMFDEGIAPKILSLTNGDLLVAYTSYDVSTTKIQRLNQNGQAVWPSPLEIITDNSSPVSLQELTNNEYMVLLQKSVFSPTSYSISLFAQKFDVNGNTLWNSLKQISTQPISSFNKNNSFTDGGNVYTAFTNDTGDGCYIQKIAPDGSLPWGDEGIKFSTNQAPQADSQIDIKIATTPGSPHIWAIASYSNNGEFVGEFVQKFDKNNGTRLLTDSAKELFPADTSDIRHIGGLYLINDNPFFVIGRGNYSINTLDAVLLNNNGDFSWPQQSIPMATYQAEKSQIASLKPVNGQNIIVFQEIKSQDPDSDSDSQIYAQNLTLPNLATYEVNNNKDSEILFPNPATTVVNIKGIKDQKYEIYTITGQLIQTGSIKEGTILVQNLSKGIYIVKTANQNKTHKFIKK